MSDRISIDLDDVEDDLLQATNDFDMVLSKQILSNVLDTKLNVFDGNQEEMPTLESILNEDDDLENDEILKTLAQSLILIDASSNKNTKVQTVSDSANADQFGNESIVSSTSSYKNASRSNSVLISNNTTIGHAQYSNLIEKNGIVCKQSQMKQISSQLITAIERSDAGLPTVLAVSQLIAIGTSRGLILLFDANQALRLYITTEYKDAISALSLNNNCDRLLVGNSLGYIFMFDTLNGKCLRKITEAHPYGNAILNLRFTDDSTIACFSDSGGSVFMLEFKRVMGVRSAESTCIFSGSRGEVCDLNLSKVCDIAPLRFEKFSENILNKLSNNSLRNSSIKRNLENINALFSKYSLLAMVSFTKIFVVTLRPKLTVIFTFSLAGNAKYLPIVNWQFVIMQPALEQENAVAQIKRYVTPILACARESTIHFFQVDYFKTNSPDSALNLKATSSGNLSANTSSKNAVNDLDYTFKFVLLKKSQYNFKIYNFCWLNAKTLAILDNTEKLHVVDIRTDEELQVLNNLTESVQLIYNSSFFKSLSTGGYVSKALAYAGENACYMTFQAYSGHLYILGKKSITQFSLQNWSDRIEDFLAENNLELALDLSLSMLKGETKALIGLPIDSKLRKQKLIDKIVDILYLYVNRAMKQDCPTNGKLDVLERHYKRVSSKCVNVCILINCQDVLFGSLYAHLSEDALFEGFFFESLEGHLLNNKLKDIPPQVVKNFIDYYEKNAHLHLQLEKCLFHFDVHSIDLHSVIGMCRKYSLLDAFIYLNNKAFNDYLTPFEELIQMMHPLLFLHYDTARQYLKEVVSSTATTTAENTEGKKLVETVGNKLLVYLYCCLCGQTYPYGSIVDDQLSDQMRRATFEFLTSKRSKIIDVLLNKEKQNIDKSPIKKYLNEYLDERSLAGAYPIIRLFLNFDVLDFLNVIAMAFNEPSFEAVIGLDKKQQLVDILIQIGFNKNANLYLKANSQLVGHLFTFLARQISNKNNNIVIDNAIFAEMIEYLCDRDESDRLEEREQSLLSLINSFSIQIMEHFDFERMLRLALRARFFRVCEILYEFRGEYYEIVDCYLNYDEANLIDDRQKQIFDVVRSLLNLLYEQDILPATATATNTPGGSAGVNVNPGIVAANMSLIMKKRLSLSDLHQKLRAFTQRSGSVLTVEPRDVQLKKLQEKLIRPRTLKKLISISPMETIHLLWIEMNIDLKYLIKSIRNFRENSQNEHLSLSSSLKQRKVFKATEKEDLDDFSNINASSSSNEFSKSSSRSADEYNFETDNECGRMLYAFMKGLFELVELIKIDRKYINYISQFSSENCEIYIDLICRFEPGKLVYELKTTLSEYSFRIDECLRICRERKHWDGAAYLLEKSGQIEAAFSLYLEKMVGFIKDLQKNLEVLSERELNILKSNIDALLIVIVQLCQRNNCALSDAAKEKIWFSLFEEIMNPIRGLFIHPSIEALLNYNTNGCDGDQQLSLRDNESPDSDEIKERLSETKEFFKNLGSYIINSMVGYLSLTTIIDRIIGDPLYGASNFGDIKDLMINMLEVCSYEQILLAKTSSLVSRDVYANMLIYKRISCKSFSLFSSFCQFCSRPLDLSTKLDTISVASGFSNTSPPSPSQMNALSPFASVSNLDILVDNKAAITIFHCGHSFHHSCLEIAMHTLTLCPVCNSSVSSSQSISTPYKTAKLKQRIKNNNDRLINENRESNKSAEFEQLREMTKPSTSGGMSSSQSSSSLTTENIKLSRRRENENDEEMSSPKSSIPAFKSSLTKQQIDALKSIRSRNMSIFKLNCADDGNPLSSAAFKQSFNTSLERQSQLSLAPANLTKFI